MRVLTLADLLGGTVMHARNRVAARLIVGAVSLVVVLSGCSGSNQGGDTTCGDYKAMSTSAQSDTIKAFLKEKGDDNPGNGKIMLMRLSAVAYCNSVASDSDTIRGIDG